MTDISRVAVYDAAARFLAAYITKGMMSNEIETQMLEKAVNLALDLEKTTERIITESSSD